MEEGEGELVSGTHVDRARSACGLIRAVAVAFVAPFAHVYVHPNYQVFRRSQAGPTATPVGFLFLSIARWY
ncbi:hypothetical protein DENSPDRAFT_591168 [Dentipellis sp. KUC8613]|nr:hypothetical protein DENSPDRAFT_591168 [Dentipellis sp. KUC8613]